MQKWLQKYSEYDNIKAYKMNSQKFMYIENRIKLLIVKYKKARNGKDRYVYKNGFNLYKTKNKI